MNLLGLRVQTSPITVTVSVEGDGKLLGNLLGVVSDLVNLDGVNNALNTVLGSTVDLVNSASLGPRNTAVGNGPLDSAAAKTTNILNLFVAPISLNLLRARVDTSSITLSITAQSGDGLVLGNAASRPWPTCSIRHCRTGSTWRSSIPGWKTCWPSSKPSCRTCRPPR